MSPLAKLFQKLFYAALLLLALVLFGFAFRALRVLFTQPPSAGAAQPRQLELAREPGLLITGWIDRVRATKGRTFSAWYRLNNVGETSVQDLRLDLTAPGFVACLRDVHQPERCDPLPTGRTGVAVTSLALPPIAAGSSATLQIDLTADGPAGDSMLTANFFGFIENNWKSASLELGPVLIRDPWFDQAAAWKDFTIAIAPLVIPVLVLGLGFIFQSRQQRFAQERQAWAAMMPYSHDNNRYLSVPCVRPKTI